MSRIVSTLYINRNFPPTLKSAAVAMDCRWAIWGSSSGVRR